MKPEKHVERYKIIRKSLNELLLKSLQERDIASISTLAHWASYHLVSVIINQAPIPENQQHKNHRGIKNVLKNSPELRRIIGNQNADLLLDLYNQIETQYLVKFQYGWTDQQPDYGKLIKLLDQIVILCKGLTKRHKNHNVVKDMPESHHINVNINRIKKTAIKIGVRNSQILSLYLFGSVARNEADSQSDVDLLFLVSPENVETFFETLTRDPDYSALESWALKLLEGGVNPLILDPQDLVTGYDTLITRIQKEGILLYGKPLLEIIDAIPPRKQPAPVSLLELVESL